MRANTYEKPHVKYVSLQNEAKIANTCWGHHSSGQELYYDTEGPGFIGFKIANGSCDLNLINVVYYTGKDAFGNPTGGTALSETDPRYFELIDALAGAGGNAGNPYHGMGSVIHDRPGEVS